MILTGGKNAYSKMVCGPKSTDSKYMIQVTQIP